MDAESYAEYVRYKEAIEYQMNSISTYSNTAQESSSIGTIRINDGPRALISLQGTVVSFLIDTGSPVNVIDETTFTALAIKPELECCNTLFYGFTSDTPIVMLGQFTTRAEKNKQTVLTKFVVAKGKQECLVSYLTAKDLNIIKILASIAETEGLSTDALHVKFPRLFSGRLGCATNVKIKLNIDPTIRPTRQPQRPVAFHLGAAVEKELLSQVEQGILEREDGSRGPTPWVANLVIVPKDRELRNAKSPPIKEHTGAIRLTCDSRGQNKAIKRTRYPSKTVEDLVYLANGATVFSKLDIIKAFHQLLFDEESRNLTTITTHIGLFRYRRLHMGISCASEIFTETIRVMLSDIQGQLNMTDDILVYGKTEAEHHHNLMAVLKRLEDNGITLNREKCQFYKHELTFYGLRFTARGISQTEDRCLTLREAVAPTNAKDMRSFLCTVLYSSRFMKDVCTIAEPLWGLTRANTQWKWTFKEQDAFEE